MVIGELKTIAKDALTAAKRTYISTRYIRSDRTSDLYHTDW